MSDDKNVRVLLAGCGGICKAWLNPTVKFDDIQIVGLVDLNIEKAEKIKADYGLQDAVTGSDLNKVLEHTTPNAVFDCTVPEAHCQVTLDSLNHECHVLGEKPMTTNMADARKMVDAALKNNRIYAVIQNRRYMDSIIRYRETVKETGGIGELTTLNTDFYMGPHFDGFRKAMKHVLLQDMAIHSFDQARFISGTDAVSVYCHEWNPKGSWFSHGASAVAIFEMTGGVVFTYRGSWCAQGLPTSWECEWRAIGTAGTAKWDGKDLVECESVIKDKGFMPDTAGQKADARDTLEHSGHAGLIREFTDCVKNGGAPQTVCTDNIKSLAMVEAAVESAETGRKIEIEN